jgi:hypothetical protein
MAGMRNPPQRRHPGPASPPGPRSRALFWVFVAAMALAVAGGGAIAALGRRSVAERRGHPDTISPAEAQRRGAP